MRKIVEVVGISGAKRNVVDFVEAETQVCARRDFIFLVNMSATVERSTSSWRKRSREDDTAQMDQKRPRHYYYRLESESSKASEEDTESVYSLQDRETDVVRDTSDTDSKSGCSDQDEYEVHYEEYEVASLTESDNDFSHSNSSSDSEDMMLAAAAVAICDSSLETWITDCEESDNSSLDDTSFGKTDFSTCLQCKSQNDNPLYRYCEKCFQDRKKFYPPRPKRTRKSRKNKKVSDRPVKLATLQSCLSGLSHDSGIGSSQECPPLDLDQIVVPEKHLTPGTSNISTISETNEKIVDDTQKDISSEVLKSVRENNLDSNNKNSKAVDGVRKLEGSSSSFSSTDTNFSFKKGRKRRLSESSLSEVETKKTKSVEVKESLSTLVAEKQLSLSQTSDLGSEVSSSSFISSLIEKSSSEIDPLKYSTADNLELCILCNDAPKDAIFLHTKVAHQCCCYKCAKRILKSIKRCPICNCTVNKVFKVVKS